MQFEWFRHEQPEGFVKLPSLGKYVNPRNGEFFDYDREGRWDDQDGNWPEEEFEELAERLTDEEIDRLSGVWRSCEELVRPQVDWSIIEDIKQCALAEEITDRGFQVRIHVRDGRQQFPNILYREWFDSGDVYWNRMFMDEYESLEETISGLKDGLVYQVTVMMRNQFEWSGYMSIDNPGGGSRVKPAMLQRKKHFMERIHSLNPGMEDRIVYVKW